MCGGGLGPEAYGQGGSRRPVGLPVAASPGLAVETDSPVGLRPEGTSRLGLRPEGYAQGGVANCYGLPVTGSLGIATASPARAGPPVLAMLGEWSQFLFGE